MSTHFREREKVLNTFIYGLAHIYAVCAHLMDIITYKNMIDHQA